MREPIRFLFMVGGILLFATSNSEAQDSTSFLVPRLDSTKDEMTGRGSYYVQLTSETPVHWTYGRVFAVLSLRCNSDAKEPRWVVASNATPKHTYRSYGGTSALQMKTDSELVSGLLASHQEVGRNHFLTMDDNKSFTKRAMKSKTLILRWELLTNELVTFHFDLSGFTPLVPTLYERCGKPLPH